MTTDLSAGICDYSCHFSLLGCEVASETIFGAKPMLLRDQTTEFYTHEYLPVLHHIFCTFQSFTNLTSHTHRRKNGKLLEDLEDIVSHCSQPSCIMFQHVTHHNVCVPVPWAFAEHWPGAYLATPSKPWHG